jgi:hypothetical protein
MRTNQFSALNCSISWANSSSSARRLPFDEIMIMATADKRQHEPQRIDGDLLNAEIPEI